MSDTYRIYCFDEFDFTYEDRDKIDFVKHVKSIIPHAKLESDIPYLMIFYIDKFFPYDGELDNIKCDKIMIGNSSNFYVPDVI